MQRIPSKTRTTRTTLKLPPLRGVNALVQTGDTVPKIDDVHNDHNDQHEQHEQQQHVVTTPNKSYLDDGFVFGLAGSGLQRPKGKVQSIVVDGDSLETKPSQVILVATTLSAHVAFSINAIASLLAINQGGIAWTAIQTLILLVSSWILADFSSGVLHWSVDNYGNGRTPIMRSIIAAFQVHHSAPWTIIQRGFANNVTSYVSPLGSNPCFSFTQQQDPLRHYS